MTIRLVLSLCFLHLTAIPNFASATQVGNTTTLLSNINVIDVTGSPVQAGMNVLIEDGLISRIQKDPIPVADANLIDGTGQYLIPGLWDMHVHWYDESTLPLFLANGVTGTRQMWGFPIHYDWKSRIETSADFVAPRTLIASVIIDGPDKIWPGSLAATNETEGRDYVRRFRDMGADFIKVYSRLEPDVYFAIADESRKAGIPFAGHVPTEVDAEDASDAGQQSFEHLYGVAIALSGERESIRAGYRDAETPADRLSLRRRMLDTHDPALMAPLFEKFKRNGTWQSPTLTVLRNFAYQRERRELDRERLAYLDAGFAEFWVARDNRSEEDWAFERRNFEHSKMLVREMNRAGVRFIAGTDVLNPYCFPGFSLHDELQLLVEAGLTPMQALQATTSNAAEFANKLDRFGTVEVGKVADLVILEADPLLSISNTTQISAVIFNGRYHDRETLDGMLKAVKNIRQPDVPETPP